MPDPASLRAKLAALGVSDRSRIVVYPTRDIQSATRVVFTLDAAGLGKQTRLLQGGTPAWAAEGHALAKDAPAPAAPGKLSAIKYRPLTVDAAFVKAHLASPHYVVVDARAPDFYSGARAGGSQAKPQKAGHIASAKSIPFSAVTTGPDLQLAGSADLEAKFAAAGIKKGDTVIAYCHVGQQATAAIFAARELGYDVRLYDGSFEDWSRRDGAVETSPAK
jgi:thiosulfate/3-mercaptopyruvate sulfurtransferase